MGRSNVGIVKKIKDNFSITGRVKTIKKYTDGRIVESDWIENTITDVGKVAIARRVGSIGLLANEGKVTYGAVGTGATTPSASATTLSTEFFRKVVSDQNIIGNIIEIRLYMDTTEGNANLTNFGLFGEDAGAGADSGTLFEIVAISEAKNNTFSLTIVAQITVA